MDTSKAKGKKNEAKKEYVVLDKVNVSRARVIETKNGDLVLFTLMINGVYINNCKVVSGKNGDFISFPQYKGSDGEYYNVVYIALSDEDQKMILRTVQEDLNAD